MSFEPQKFFIGLMDFFAVLLPGGVLAYVVPRLDSVRSVLDLPIAALESASDWVVFVFLAYLLGHIVFLIGSFLDDLVYQPLRDGSRAGQLLRLASGEALSARWIRQLAARKWMFGRGADAAVLQVLRLKARLLRGANGAINAFQWAKAFLSKEHPEGLAIVNRFEADSKFFRSFAVVLVILAIAYAIEGAPARTLTCLVLMLLSLWRYIEQRFKATQQAYWFVITANASKPITVAPVERADGLTHAGGVIYRTDMTPAQFLLVKASKGRDEWVLPKGHIESGESPAETAVREALEETGVLARIIATLEDLPLQVGGEQPFVRFFLMERVEDAAAAEGRATLWHDAETAIRTATHTESKALIRRAVAAIRHIRQ